MEERNIAELRPSDRNPRIMTDRVQRKLQASLKRFGDLGCIVLNRTSGNLVGGTQRTTTIATDPSAKFVITTKFDKPNKQGTVEEGYVEYLGERYKARVVVWDEATEKSARIAANALHAEWDQGMLAEEIRDLLGSDVELARMTSFDDKQLDVLAAGGLLGEKPDGEMVAKPKQIRYTSEDLEAHKQRFLAIRPADGGAAEKFLNEFLRFVKAGEPAIPASVTQGAAAGQ